MIVREILAQEGHVYLTGNLEIPVEDMVGKWRLRPDILVVPNTVIEVDGPYHKTPTERRKTKWRDALLVGAGYRVIHIDSELTKNQKLRDYLKTELNKAIQETEAIVRIDA